MNRVFSIKEDNFKRAMNFYRHVVRDDIEDWRAYKDTAQYDEEEFDFKLMYNNLQRSKKCFL